MNRLKTTLTFALILVSAQAFAQSAYQESTPEQRELKQRTLEKLKAIEGSSLIKVDATSPLTLLQATVKGTFWRNPEWIKLLDLSPDQQRKMDDVFQQYRLKLIDLTGSLQKEEIILEPLLASGKPAPDAEAKIFIQIDRIADARAELEKANSRMLVGILRMLSAEQWSKLPVPTKKSGPIFNKLGK
jgi:Spy/CpxP family protein refolding chaperone